MHAELSHTYPVPLEQGFDYVADFHNWPSWYVGMSEILEPEQASWRDPGDEVRFRYSVLGRQVEGVAILEDRTPAEMARFRTEVPGLPVFHFTYHYSRIGRDSFELNVTMDTDEPTTLFGRAVDRTLLPRTVERDVERSLENLEDIFGAGLLG
ncbi:MAG: SRPBCC family protein [Acidimicrobiia bacterium]|jgi:hypothetical protein